MGYKPGLNTFTIICKQEDIPPSEFLSDSRSGVLESWKFFKFSIDNPGFSRVEVLVTPGKGYIALFVSANLYFPNEDEHTWSSGVYENDKVTEPEDFVLDSNTYYDPDPYDEMLSRCYTRKPTMRELTKLKRITKTSADPVRFCIDTDDWKYTNQFCYIGLKNLTDSPIQFTIKKKEFTEDELLSGEIAKKFSVFREIFSRVEGSSISQVERKRLNCTGKSEFTYGEIDFVHMWPVFGLCKPKPGEVFWDLGCGAGKCMGAIALLYPELKKVCGVEYLDKLYDTCNETMEKLKQNCSQLPEIVVKHGDMLNVDWSDADIIFSSSICFPNELIDGIISKCDRLKKGTRFITLKSFMNSAIFEIKFNIRVKMTWGKTGVYVLEKIV